MNCIKTEVQNTIQNKNKIVDVLHNSYNNTEKDLSKQI